MSHTPGPWDYVDEHDSEDRPTGYYSVIGNNGLIVCRNAMLHDARLMAASLRHLAVSQAVLVLLETMWPPGYHPPTWTIQDLKSAIAAALPEKGEKS